MLKAEPGVFCGILLGTVSILFSGAFYLKSPTQWILGYFIGFWAYLVLFFKAQRSRFFLREWVDILYSRIGTTDLSNWKWAHRSQGLFRSWETFLPILVLLCHFSFKLGPQRDRQTERQRQTNKPVGDVARDAASFASYRRRCLLAQAVLRTDGQTQPRTRCLTVRVAYSLQRREPMNGQDP